MKLKIIMFLLSLVIFSMITGFKFNDIMKKLDSPKDNSYEVKNSSQATGVRGLENEGKIETDVQNIETIEIPCSEVTAEELEHFKKQGGLK
ncbi:hypothetical protein KA977_12625 [Candidatus Dependentiae bacterium]|nr:hypothetical protein [Candidatus Dependentiae bacterium]